jgi:hypothetical protein
MRKKFNAFHYPKVGLLLLLGPVRGDKDHLNAASFTCNKANQFFI